MQRMEGYIKRLTLALFIAITMGQGTITYAQDSLIGKYNGTLEVPPTNHAPVGIEVLTVTGETVTGIGHRFGGPCSGDYPFSGTVKGNTLKIKHTKMGGPAGDCGFRFTLTVEGDKLVGTFANKFSAKFSKQQQ